MTKATMAAALLITCAPLHAQEKGEWAQRIFTPALITPRLANSERPSTGFFHMQNSNYEFDHRAVPSLDRLSDDRVANGVGALGALTPFQRFALSMWHGLEGTTQRGEGGVVASGPATLVWMVRGADPPTARWKRRTGRYMQGNPDPFSLGNEVWVRPAVSPQGSRQGSRRGGGFSPVWCVETDAETSYCFSVSR